MFQRRVRVTKRGYLLEIPRQKGSDRTSLLILVHVAKLVGEQEHRLIAPTDEHGVTKGQADQSQAPTAQSVALQPAIADPRV